MRSTSNALVARMRLLAVGVGKVFSSAAKKACVWKGGLVDGRGSLFIVDGTLDLTRDLDCSSVSIASPSVGGLSNDELEALLCELASAEWATDMAISGLGGSPMGCWLCAARRRTWRMGCGRRSHRTERSMLKPYLALFVVCTTVYYAATL